MTGVSVANSKSDLVKTTFDNTGRYLTGWSIDIRMRVETVKEYAADLRFERILDIGCGDGSVSLPLLKDGTHLTLLDLSSNMTAIAKSNISFRFKDDVSVRNENFAKASFDLEEFDLVICLGVLAHVDEPEAFVAKIASVLKPGGNLILQFTDSDHFVGRQARFLRGLRGLIAPPRYAVNLFSAKRIERLLERHSFRRSRTFRYGQIPLPEVMRLVSTNTTYRILRSLFGTSCQNRNAWLGNEHIWLLTMDRMG